MRQKLHVLVVVLAPMAGGGVCAHKKERRAERGGTVSVLMVKGYARCCKWYCKLAVGTIGKEGFKG